MFARDIAKAVVTNIYLAELVKEGRLERVEQGVYITPDVLEDRMFIPQSCKSRIDGPRSSDFQSDGPYRL